MEEKRPPGLRFDGDRPMWRASKPAVKAGYPVKSVNLSSLADDPRLLRERCVRLQQEMLEWLSAGDRKQVRFDGTFRTLLDYYQTEPKSPYFGLKYASRKPYDVYIRMMHAEIGRCRIDRTTGVDVLEWFGAWAAPDEPGGPRHVGRARMAIAVMKAAMTFGVMGRLPGCAEFRVILDAMKGKFESLQPRTAVISADQVIAARAAVRAAGHPLAALAYAIQFEGTVRQWDVVGQWLPLSDWTPSAIIHKGKKWIGPTWANVDENLILRYRPTKTEGTTAKEVVVDLRVCPMVMEELQDVPQSARKGPLIVNPSTGRPYSQDRLQEIWRAAAKVAGIPASVWNRDLRASGSTEARDADAKTDDLQKLMGHGEKSKTTAKVYDRAHLAAHRRIAQARNAHRGKKE